VIHGVGEALANQRVVSHEDWVCFSGLQNTHVVQLLGTANHDLTSVISHINVKSTHYRQFNTFHIEIEVSGVMEIQHLAQMY